MPNTCRACVETGSTRPETPRAMTRTTTWTPPPRPSQRPPPPLTTLATETQTERGYRGGCGASGSRHLYLSSQESQSFIIFLFKLLFSQLHKATTTKIFSTIEKWSGVAMKSKHRVNLTCYFLQNTLHKHLIYESILRIGVFIANTSFASLHVQ